MGLVLLIFAMVHLKTTASDVHNVPDHIMLKETMDMLMKSEFEKIRSAKGHTKPIYFILYKNVNGETTRSVATVEDKGVLHAGHLDSRHPVKIGIHGWQQTMTSKFVKTMVPAYLESLKNVQVVIVRWKAADQGYVDARLSISNTAETIIHYLQRISFEVGINLEEITIIGHSMGAQLAGAIGNQAHGAIGTIVALDPANPLMWENTSDVVSIASAKKVIGVHTNPGYYGINWNVGHVDFWPNLGTTPQPNCFFGKEGSHNNSVKKKWHILQNSFSIMTPPPRSQYYHSYGNGMHHQLFPELWFYGGPPVPPNAINYQIPFISGEQANPWLTGGRGTEETYRGPPGRKLQPSRRNIMQLACSHEQSIHLFFESVRNGSAYPARKCECPCTASCKMERTTKYSETYFNENTNVVGQYCFNTK